MLDNHISSTTIIHKIKFDFMVVFKDDSSKKEFHNNTMYLMCGNILLTFKLRGMEKKLFHFSHTLNKNFPQFDV